MTQTCRVGSWRDPGLGSDSRPGSGRFIPAVEQQVSTVAVRITAFVVWQARSAGGAVIRSIW